MHLHEITSDFLSFGADFSTWQIVVKLSINEHLLLNALNKNVLRILIFFSNFYNFKRHSYRTSAK